MTTSTNHTTCVALTLLTLCLAQALGAPEARAVHPLLKGRAFVGKSLGTAPSLWPELPAQPIAGLKDAEPIRDWMLAHRDAFSTWPPGFRSQAETVAQIKAWQKLAPAVAQLGEKPPETVDSLVFQAAFWRYGHHVDEPKAAHRAFAVIERGKVAFPDSAVPELLDALFRLEVDGKDPLPHLLEAQKRTSEPSLLTLVHLGLADEASQTCRRHAIALHVADARGACATCLAPFALKIRSWNGVFGVDPRYPAQEIFELNSGELMSDLLGLRLQLLENWLPRSNAEYDPREPFVGLTVSAPVAGAKVPQHGLTIVAAVGASEPIESSPFFKKLQAGTTTFRKIDPLVQDDRMQNWYEFTTDWKLANGDTIAGILVTSKRIEATQWTLAQHQQAAKDDPPSCGMIAAAQATPEFKVMRVKGARVRAHVDFAFVLNASRQTLDPGRAELKQFLASLQLESAVGSAVLDP